AFHVTGVQTCALPIFVGDRDRDSDVDRLEDVGHLEGLALAATIAAAAVLLAGDGRHQSPSLAAGVFGEPLGGRAHPVGDERQRRSEERRVGKEGRSWW